MNDRQKWRRPRTGWCVGAALTLALGLGGCADDETTSADGGSSPADETRFEADPAGTGPRLWLEVEFDASEQATISLWGAELGPVFGWSTHLSYDSEHLTPEPSRPPAVELSALAPSDVSEALALVTTALGDVGLGASRLTPALGETPIDEPTRLGTATLRPLRAGESRLGLERVVVRRADGSYQGTTATGGTLFTVGGGS